MTDVRRSFASVVLVLTVAGCPSEESDLEQHAQRCESLCTQAQQECSAEEDFADPWSLACEVACNLDVQDELRPFAACMDDATTCDDKNACVNAGPGTASSGTSDASTPPATPDDDDSGTPDPPETTGPSDTDPGTDESSGGVVEGHPCCDLSGAACADAAVQECTCQHMPGCCTGVWGEVCASVAVANGCIDDGCPSLEGWSEWNCSCSTTDVYCADDPFVSQLIFPTDACGVSEADAIAIASAACEQGNGTCEIGLGSCDCTCTDYGDTCWPTED